jgi:hypothetical protein
LTSLGTPATMWQPGFSDPSPKRNKADPTALNLAVAYFGIKQEALSSQDSSAIAGD